MSYYCKSCGSMLPYKDAQCSTCHYENRDHDRIWGKRSNSSSTQSSFTGHKEEIYAKGDRYVGDFVNGKRHGKGIYYHANNAAKYVGEYYNGVRHGFGIEDIRLPEGTQHYEGEWYRDKRHGKGKMICADGVIYEGEYKEGERHGHGVIIYPDGEKYEGEWVAGKRNGQGTYFYASGAKYEGSWVDGERHGKGTHYYVNPSGKYVGDFYKDVRHGFGIEDIHVPEGTQHYEGEWQNGKRHGKGKMIGIDGETYEGEYKEEKRHGRGRCVLPDGTVQDGYFENGEFVGAAESAYEVDDREMDISPEMLAQFVANESSPASQAAPKAEPPKDVEESFEGMSDQEIWDRLLKMSDNEKKAYFEKHHELTVPAGTEIIPASCFRMCFGINKINFNEELREIGEHAFTGARINSVLVIPKSVEKIGHHAFDMCRSFEKLVLPNNITVEDYAFSYTDALAEVEFETEPPQGVVLGTGVFARCDKHAMTSKEMIKKIKALNKKAFK